VRMLALARENAAVAGERIVVRAPTVVALPEIALADAPPAS